MNDTYRFVCEDIDAVLLIKILSPEEEKNLFSKMRKGLVKSNGIVEISSYKRFLVEQLSSNFETFIGTVPEDEDEENYIEAAYECIVNAFPMFSIEFMCADINAAAFIEKHGEEIPDSLMKAIGGYKTLSASDIEIPLSEKQHLLDLSTDLCDNIIGQQKAVSSIINSLKVRASGLSDHCSFFFVGPTGVGKSEFAKILGNHFGGNFYKINCGEYAAAHEYSKLIGSPPGYLGHDKKGIFAEKAAESNAWIFLFDEIEKAHHKLYDVLLSLLDEGTCTDSEGNELDFSKSIFIFTSNKGMDEVKLEEPGFASFRTQAINKVKDETRVTLDQALKRHFSAEFLNRLDEIVIFNQLSNEDVRKIVRMNLDGLPINVTDEIVDSVVDASYSVEYGARNVKRYIKRAITPAIADAILDKKMPANTDYYEVQLNGDSVELINLTQFEEKHQSA